MKKFYKPLGYMALVFMIVTMVMLIALKIIYMDMTEMRFLFTFWYLHLIGATTAFLAAYFFNKS